MTNNLLNGDAIEQLKNINNETIDCVMTSPPYYHLRDYQHKKQIGQEKSIEEYIDNLEKIFIEIFRVLKKTGTCFVNINDTYENKNMLLIPQRFVLMMQKNGWLVRNVIIWHKPNKTPESCSDRFTNDFEYVFFFTKSSQYFFKQLLQPNLWANKDRRSLKQRTLAFNTKYSKINVPSFVGYKQEGKNTRCVWSINTNGNEDIHFAVFPEELVVLCLTVGCPIGGIVLDPFMGVGTTGIVSLKQGKYFWGIELNSEYFNIAKKKISSLIEQQKLA